MLLDIIEHAGVVLQYVFLPQDLPEDLGVLLNDGGVRNDVDHPVQPVGPGVAQGEGREATVFPPPVGTVRVNSPGCCAPPCSRQRLRIRHCCSFSLFFAWNQPEM